MPEATEVSTADGGAEAPRVDSEEEDEAGFATRVATTGPAREAGAADAGIRDAAQGLLTSGPPSAGGS